MLARDVEKATQALAYFAQREGGAIDKLKALKLVFFADRYHLRNYGRPVIGDAYWAMKRGPVASTTKDVAEGTSELSDPETQYAGDFIDPARANSVIQGKRAPDLGVFSETDREALAFAYETFGHLNPIEISDLTHDYPEWKHHEITLDLRSRVRMNYEHFFENPSGNVRFFEKDPFETDPETLQLIKEIFLEELPELESIC